MRTPTARVTDGRDASDRQKCHHSSREVDVIIFVGPKERKGRHNGGGNEDVSRRKPAAESLKLPIVVGRRTDKPTKPTIPEAFAPGPKRNYRTIAGNAPPAIPAAPPG